MAKGREHVLIIDDDAITRLLFRKVLEGGGFTVAEAENTSAGIEAANKQAPHLIILDLVMPGFSGFEFLEHRRKLKTLETIPVMVVSALSDRESIYRATSLGAADYLVKPVDSKTLLQKVLRCLHDRAFHRVLFPKESKPTVRVRATGKIILGNEVGFLLEAPVKIAPETKLDIKSPLINELGIGAAIFQKTPREARAGFPGQYLNDVAAIGLLPEAIERIRKIIKGWR